MLPIMLPAGLLLWTMTHPVYCGRFHVFIPYSACSGYGLLFWSSRNPGAAGISLSTLLKDLNLWN